MQDNINKFESEIKLIDNPGIRRIVEMTLQFAPDYFWIAPSSSSGKYHPVDELGEGGIVKHVKKVVKIGYDLCSAFDLKLIDRDVIVAALLLHDVCKFGYPENIGHLVAGHGYLVANVMREAKILNYDMPDGSAVEILKLIAGHMGRWDVPFKCPEEKMGLIVHLADYVASRRYIGVEL